MSRGLSRFLMRFDSAIMLVMAPSLATAQVVVKLNDTVNFRFGMQIQSWADWTQDANSEGYSQNFFIRRVRFQLLATVAPRVSIFYQTDNPRYGSAGVNGVKTINTGFLIPGVAVRGRSRGVPGRPLSGADLPQRSREHGELPCFRHRDVGASGQHDPAGQRRSRLRLRVQRLSLGRQTRISRGPFRRRPAWHHSAAGAPRRGRRLPQLLPVRRAPELRLLRLGEGLHVRGNQPGHQEDRGDRRVVRHPEHLRGLRRRLRRGLADQQGRDQSGVRLQPLRGQNGKGVRRRERGSVASKPERPLCGCRLLLRRREDPTLRRLPAAQLQQRRGQAEEPAAGRRRHQLVHFRSELQDLALYEGIIPKVQPPTAKLKDTNHFAIQVQALYF